MSDSASEGGAGERPLALLTILFGAHASLFLLYLMSQVQQGFATPRDWLTYQRTAQRLVSGEWSFYATDFFSDPHRYLYPPYGVWYFVPLAWTPGSWAYVAMVVVQLAAAGASIGLLRRYASPVLVAGLLGSQWLLFDLMVGQLAATFLLGAVLAVWAWESGYPVLAGVIWGLAAIKPQFVWPAVLVAGFADRRVFAGLALTGVGLALSTLPLGLDSWWQWIETARAQAAYATGELTVTHNASWVGFLRGVVGADAALWINRISLPLGLGAAAYGAWRHRADPAACLSIAWLLGLSLNVYVNTYDLIVLFLPAVAWAARRHTIDPRLFWTVAASGVACWFWDEWVVVYRNFLGLPKSPVGSATGALCLLWLFAWASVPALTEPIRLTPEVQRV